MDIIGCDLHSRYQNVAWVEEATGEIRSRRLEHENGEARAEHRQGKTRPLDDLL